MRAAHGAEPSIANVNAESLDVAAQAPGRIFELHELSLPHCPILQLQGEVDMSEWGYVRYGDLAQRGFRVSGRSAGGQRAQARERRIVASSGARGFVRGGTPGNERPLEFGRVVVDGRTVSPNQLDNTRRP